MDCALAYLLLLVLQCKSILATIIVGNELPNRPEEVFFNVLTKSLILDTDIISEKCQRDSEIYRNALSTYQPWALQSK